METFSGVSSLILALFLHFSEVPKGEMCRRNKHSRIYVEAAYIWSASHHWASHSPRKVIMKP